MMLRRRLFTLGETEICLHLATLLFAAYMLLMGQGMMLAMGTVSILLHEAAHGTTATLLGHPPQEIELTPLGALLRLDDEAALPIPKRLMMLAAGPICSFALCWLAIFLTKAGILTAAIGRMLFCCNLAQVLLNLLPALPLDGGRMLALLLSLRLRNEMVRRIMRGLGTALGLSLIVINFWLSLRHGGWNLSLTMAGCFLMYAATVGTTSTAMAELRMLMDRKIRLESRGSLPCQWMTIMASLPLRKAVKLLHPSRHTMFQMVELGSMQRLCQVSEDAVIAAYLDRPGAVCQSLCGRDHET